MEVSVQLHTRGRSPGIPRFRELGGPRARMDAVAKRKIPTPAVNRTSVVRPVA
jgi:hypothetical protein